MTKNLPVSGFISSFWEPISVKSECCCKSTSSVALACFYQESDITHTIMGTISREKIYRTIAHLNDLTEIHNDRSIAFEKAISETDDEDLVAIFTTMAAHSRSFKSDLIKAITLLGGQIHHRRTFSNSYQRVWNEIKIALESKNKQDIISACEIEEDTTLGIYKLILSDNDHPMPLDLKKTIEIQKEELEFVYGRLSALKNSRMRY
jgi:uncharacterized protein (TIGR02284 family)